MMVNTYSTFSVELIDGNNINKVILEMGEDSLIEGNLGEIITVLIHDDVLLEVTGSKGVLRVDLPLRLIKTAIGDEQ
jgi:hypothetical protein